MKKILKVLIEITFDVFNNVAYFLENNLVNFANILNLILPYIMYFIGQSVCINRNEITIGGELVIPLIFVVLIYYLKSSANKIGKGITVPIPDKRFTVIDDDGEVSMEHGRISELLLYMADLEDWIEKKGLFK